MIIINVSSFRISAQYCCCRHSDIPLRILSAMENSIVPYGFFLEYARRYDAEWRDMLEKLISILKKLCPHFFLPQRPLALHFEYHRTSSFRSKKSLPDESVIECMKYMSYKDLNQAGMVCKQWNVLAQKNELWENLLLITYGMNLENFIIGRKGIPRAYFGEEDVMDPRIAFRMMLQAFLNVALQRGRNSTFRTPPIIPSSFLFWVGKCIAFILWKLS